MNRAEGAPAASSETDRSDSGSRVSRLAFVLLVSIPLVLSPPVSVRAQECIALEDFSAGKVGELPPGWKLRADEGRGVYTIREEGGRRYLHAVSQGIGIQAAKEITWDLARYPVLTWSWRPVEFPTGADERNSKTNDSAVAVYGVFPHRMGSVRSVKYVWSAVVPIGTRLNSNMGLTQVRVLRTGTQNKGRWTDERVNLLDDYRKYFDVSDTPKPAGIAVLTDADDTKSRAQGDYASFRACAR
jgi:Protein of unknown function (DUF3047)